MQRMRVYGAWSGNLLGSTVAVVLAFTLAVVLAVVLAVAVVVAVPLSSGIVLVGSLDVTLGRGAARVVSADGCGAWRA
ncbi:MAG: hypothetical protein Q8K82_05255 [Gemmatimonadaceae bacterium]|nr:hypothetical protein [Gemmatimonadaceae bacterium]